MFKALVVDDNRSTADSIVRVLVVLGIEAQAAYGPASGMNALNKELPDMIFMDINMPKVSGFEIMSYIRSEPRLSKIPVFFCSSDDQPQTRQQAMQAGARAFLIKPVTVAVLETSLKKFGFL
jgi:CheY-like chemotaxis protein